MKRFIFSICILAIFSLSLCQDGSEWDYKSHGSDWEWKCTTLQPQAPINIISSKSSPFDSPSYYYPKTNKNVTLTLMHTYKGNHLILQTTDSPFATLSANYITMFEVFYGDYYCTEIYFKFPGEHHIDNITFDMELQVHCKDKKGELFIVGVPVNKTNDDGSQSIFFNSLESLISESITQNNLPYNVTISHFGDFLDGFSILDGIFFYESFINFPPCGTPAYYTFSSRPLKIKTTLHDQIKSCINSEKAASDGTNNRNAFEMSVMVDLYKYRIA